MKTASGKPLPTALVAVLSAVLATLAPAGLAAQAGSDVAATPPQSADSAAVAAVIDDFHRALSRGDSARVLALLAPTARILEGGGVETVEEYASHHLPADMAFASAVDRARGPVRIVVRGDVAWASSTSRVTGTFRDREIDASGAELVVLARADEGWRIEAIHWSSR